MAFGCYSLFILNILNRSKMITAKQQAVLDILDDLGRDSKCFLAFREKLNPVMDELVKNYIKLQEET